MAYKKKEKPGIMLYWDAFNALEDMVDGEAKQMLRAMHLYARYGELPDFGSNPALRMAWVFMKSYIDRDSCRYEEVSEQKSQAGEKGAQVRWMAKYNKDGKDGKDGHTHLNATHHQSIL
jgi:hypothetical protein